MAYIPLKQTVTITRKGETGEWGIPKEPTEPFDLKCRVDEQTKLVKNQLGNEVISRMNITFDKLADIRYDDKVAFTNELGDKIEGSPLSIEPIRFVNGKPVMTIVYI